MAAPGHIAALQAAGFAMQVDLAPLATQAQLAAATAPLATQAQLAAATAPLATQATVDAHFTQLVAMLAGTNAQLAAMQAGVNAQLAAMQAGVNAQLAAVQAQLAVAGVPAIAGAALDVVRHVAAARAHNAHDRRGVAYVVVPRADGTPPPHWPDGFDRDGLVEGPVAAVDALLADYGVPHGPPAGLFVRRNALARCIGAACV